MWADPTWSTFFYITCTVCVVCFDFTAAPAFGVRPRCLHGQVTTGMGK